MEVADEGGKGEEAQGDGDKGNGDAGETLGEVHIGVAFNPLKPL